MFCWKNCWEAPCRTEQYLLLIFLVILDQLSIAHLKRVKSFQDSGSRQGNFSTRISTWASFWDWSAEGHHSHRPRGPTISFLYAPEVFSSVPPCSLHVTCRAVLVQRERCNQQRGNCWHRSHDKIGSFLTWRMYSVDLQIPCGAGWRG